MLCWIPVPVRSRYRRPHVSALGISAVMTSKRGGRAGPKTAPQYYRSKRGVKRAISPEGRARCWRFKTGTAIAIAFLFDSVQEQYSPNGRR